MLTINQVAKLCEAGVDVHVGPRSDRRLLAELNTCSLDITAARPDDTRDWGVSFLRELILAREHLGIPNGQQHWLCLDNSPEESEAYAVYDWRKKVFEFAMELYGLNGYSQRKQ